MRPDSGAFSSQVVSLGASENATRQRSIFKPSGFAWRLGKCDQTAEHFQAKWFHLAARKMRPDSGAFSSQVVSLGGSENATRQRSIFKPSGFTWRLGKCDQTMD
jgi:hypothetical protein